FGDLNEGFFAQLLQVLLARIFGAIHGRRAGDHLLHFLLVVGAHSDVFAGVNANDQKAILHADWLSDLTGLQRRNGGGHLFAQLVGLEGAELALLSARSAGDGRVGLDRLRKAAAGAQLGNDAARTLFDFSRRVAFERDEDF